MFKIWCLLFVSILPAGNSFHKLKSDLKRIDEGFKKKKVVQPNHIYCFLFSDTSHVFPGKLGPLKNGSVRKNFRSVIVHFISHIILHKLPKRKKGKEYFPFYPFFTYFLFFTGFSFLLSPKICSDSLTSQVPRPTLLSFKSTTHLSLTNCRC